MLSGILAVKALAQGILVSTGWHFKFGHFP